MLSCKQVAHLASQILDQDAKTSLKWQMRLHLLMCANCRRFVRHLRITQALVPKIVARAPLEYSDTDAQLVLARIKAREQAPNDQR